MEAVTSKMDMLVQMFTTSMNLDKVTGLTDEMASYIIERADTLKELDLKGCALLTDSSLSLLLHHCPHLELLNISGTRASYELAHQLETRGIQVTFEAHPSGKYVYTPNSSIEREWYQQNDLFISTNGILVVDLFSAWRGAGAGFVDLGCRVVGVELSHEMNSKGAERVNYIESHVMNVLDIDRDWCDDLKKRLGPVSAVWASPPCTSFSTLMCERHWTSVRGPTYPPVPKSATAQLGAHIVRHTLRVIDWLSPDYFWIENPRGILRHLPYLKHLEFRHVTYCSYGHSAQKPTDLWGRFPRGWIRRECCTAHTKYGITINNEDGLEWVNNFKGEPCHIKSIQSNGKRGGLLQEAHYGARALVPIELSRDVARSLL